jgi:hypothetical protein
MFSVNLLKFAPMSAKKIGSYLRSQNGKLAMDRPTLLKHDAARHVRASHEQILQELHRKTKDRQSRERLKNLRCFLVVCSGILTAFLIVGVSEEMSSTPHRSALEFHSTLVRHVESIMPEQVTSPIQVRATGWRLLLSTDLQQRKEPHGREM